MIIFGRVVVLRDKDVCVVDPILQSSIEQTRNIGSSRAGLLVEESNGKLWKGPLSTLSTSQGLQCLALDHQQA